MAFHTPTGKQAGKKPKPAPTRLPNCWLCSGCGWWQFACHRGTDTPVKSCFRTRDCGILRGPSCVHWKNASAAQKAKPGGTAAAAAVAGTTGGAAPAGGAPVGGAPAPAPATAAPWRQQRAARQQRLQQNGGGGAHGPKTTAATKESPELVAARAAARAHESIVEIYLDRFGEGTQVTLARTKLDAATAEVDRLLPKEPSTDQVARAALQQDYDRYLGTHGAEHPITVSLRKQLDSGTAPESTTAAAVRQARTLLDLLLEHQPDEVEQIREARSALDQAKIANGSRESDCYQSAEAALRQAEEAVDAIHAEIETTKTAYDAVVAKQQKQATELLAATEARDAARLRVQERMVAISTKAPGILQASDAQTMAERMQQLDTITRHVHGLSTQHGGATPEALQRVLDCVGALMQAAPSSVFTQSITTEPQAAVQGGLVVADGAAASCSQLAPKPPVQSHGTSAAALQAKFDAREVERAAAETRANNERAAEAAAIQEAAAAEAAAAAAATAAASATAAALARAQAAGSTTAVQYQVGATTAMAVDA